MKKFLSFAALAAMCVSTFTACSDDDTPTPTPTPVTVTNGLFVINAGNSSAQIDGSLTFISKDGNVVQNAFSTANGRSLGNTPNDAIVHGSKLYIAVTGENTIEVIDRNTLKSTQISTTKLMGDDKGKQPRRLLAGGKYVFVSTFDGYVAQIDTTDYTLANIYQAGSYPEGMAGSGSTLYVANSDYGSGVNPSISAIDLNTGNSTELKNELVMNPTSLAAVGDNLYILDYGRYDENYNQQDAGVRLMHGGNVTKVVAATMMAVDAQRGLIYTVNAPYTYPATPVTYNVYNISTGENKTFISGDDIESPAAIAVDPANGDVYIMSYKMDYDTGFADYFTNGYVNQYTADGTFVKQYATGVGPTTLVFNYYTMYE